MCQLHLSNKQLGHSCTYASGDSQDRSFGKNDNKSFLLKFFSDGPICMRQFLSTFSSIKQIQIHIQF